MPPWHADPQLRQVQQRPQPVRSRTATTLLGWIDQGCPKGDADDLPPAKEFAEGWTIGKPDVVFTMPEEFTVPAEAAEDGI